MNPATTLRPAEAQIQPAPAARKGQIAVLHALTWLGAWTHASWQRARSRRALLRLDEHMLKDIGINRSDAFQEARKFFWQE